MKKKLKTNLTNISFVLLCLFVFISTKIYWFDKFRICCFDIIKHPSMHLLFSLSNIYSKNDENNENYLQQIGQVQIVSVYRSFDHLNKCRFYKILAQKSPTSYLQYTGQFFKLCCRIYKFMTSLVYNLQSK